MSARTWWRDALTGGGIVVIALVLVPVLGALVFLGRGVLFAIALVAAGIAAAAWASSPRFREWLGQPRPAPEGDLRYKGFHLPAGLALAPHHVWARIDGKRATVGIDDLARAAIGPPDAIELPRPGVTVGRGEPLFTVRRGTRSLTARSPVSGEVEAVNPTLASRPAAIEEAPFGAGWAVRLFAPDMAREAGMLHRREEGRVWFRHEVDRLISAVAGRDAVPTLPDGGVAIGNFHHQIDDPTWERVSEVFFGSEPS